MKIKAILVKASKCKTQADADNLLDALQRAFGNAKPVRQLVFCNPESCMEGDKPFVSFELNKVISNHYVTMIRPEIRDGKFVVVITTNHMLDGLGLSSQSWQSIKGMEEDVIELDADHLLTESAQKAKAIAIANHAKLIERVGVAPAHAMGVAKKSW